jgi:A1 cistron-splicing factor AAR2
MERDVASKLSPEQARALVEAGAFVVCVDVPAGTEFGIDYMTFQTGKRFKGVKMVPPGFHFLYTSGNQQNGYRSGFFCRLSRAQVLVHKWDTEAEELSSGSGMTQQDEERMAAAVRKFEFDRELGPYPGQGYSAWTNLTGMISDTVLVRCNVPLGAKVMPDDPFGKETKGEASVVPYFEGVARVARFTAVRTLPSLHSGTSRPMSAAELTRYNMDGSEQLEQLLGSEYKGSEYKASSKSAAGEELLGELQLAFVIFLLLHSLGALQHWKHTVALLCSCETAMRQPLMAPFFRRFIGVLRAQLLQAGEDMFEEGGELAENNFLEHSLRSLFQIMQGMASGEGEEGQSTADTAALLKEGIRFRKFVVKRFGIELPSLDTQVEPQEKEKDEGMHVQLECLFDQLRMEEGEDMPAVAGYIADDNAVDTNTMHMSTMDTSAGAAAAGAAAAAAGSSSSSSVPGSSGAGEESEESVRVRLANDWMHAQAMGFALFDRPEEKLGGEQGEKQGGEQEGEGDGQDDADDSADIMGGSNDSEPPAPPMFGPCPPPSIPSIPSIAPPAALGVPSELQEADEQRQAFEQLRTHQQAARAR